MIARIDPLVVLQGCVFWLVVSLVHVFELM